MSILTPRVRVRRRGRGLSAASGCSGWVVAATLEHCSSNATSASSTLAVSSIWSLRCSCEACGSSIHSGIFNVVPSRSRTVTALCG